MIGRIEHTEGSRRPLLILLVLVGILAVTVAVQVSRFAGTAGASSEPQSARAITPGIQNPTTSDPESTDKPAAGSSSAPATAPPSATTLPSSPSSKPPDPGVTYTISGTVIPLLNPGGPAVPINVGFSNPNVGNGGSGIGGVRVSSLVVSITSVTASPVNGSPRCSATDFELSQFSGPYPFYVPHGASTLASLGFGAEAWPTLRMKETGTNQNGCKGATVILGYTGAP